MLKQFPLEHHEQLIKLLRKIKLLTVTINLWLQTLSLVNKVNSVTAIHVSTSRDFAIDLIQRAALNILLSYISSLIKYDMNARVTKLTIQYLT